MSVLPVQNTAGKVHVLYVHNRGYGIDVLGNSVCGRHLVSYSYPVDLSEVTTKQVCHICIKHLPKDEP